MASKLWIILSELHRGCLNSPNRSTYKQPGNHSHPLLPAKKPKKTKNKTKKKLFVSQPTVSQGKSFIMAPRSCEMGYRPGGKHQKADENFLSRYSVPERTPLAPRAILFPLFPYSHVACYSIFVRDMKTRQVSLLAWGRVFLHIIRIWRRVVLAAWRPDTETDSWSENVGLMPSTSDTSNYWVSMFINIVRLVYDSHHVRCVLGKEVVCPALIFKYVFGFDFLWSTGLFLAILRTVKILGKSWNFWRFVVFVNFDRQLPRKKGNNGHYNALWKDTTVEFSQIWRKNLQC